MMMYRCMVCKEGLNIKENLCKSCLSLFEEAKLDLYYKRCSMCGMPLLNFDYQCPECDNRQGLYVTPIFDYRNTFAHNLLFNYKFGNFDFLSKIFTKELQSFLDLKKKYDVIVPVPCSFSSLKFRGWDQVKLIVDNIKNYPIEYMITRNDDYRIMIEQKTLNRNERFESSINKYNLRVNSVDKNARILIVDDIITTGATLLSCYRLLKRNGFNNVEAFSFYIQF